MDKESITEFWNDSLVRFNMELLSKCSLTQETKEFLELFGLPVNCEFLKDLNISFYNILSKLVSRVAIILQLEMITEQKYALERI